MAAGALLFLAVQPAAGQKGGKVKSIELNQDQAFSGRLAASKPCRAKRRIQLLNAASGEVVAKARTSKKGRFSGPSDYHGPARAKAKKKTVFTDDGSQVFCKPGRSGVLTVAEADLRLALEVVGIGQTFPEVHVQVDNFGPSTASNVLIGTVSNLAFVPPATDFVGNPRNNCPASGGFLTCTVGNLSFPGSGSPNVFFVRIPVQQCSTEFLQVSASVITTTFDPNPSNNVPLTRTVQCP